MTNPGRFLWNSMVEAYYAAADLIVINVLWAVLTLLVVTAPPAAAGLYYATNQLAHNRSAGVEVFFQGFRRYFWISWKLTLGYLLGLAILGVNFAFYGRFQGGWVIVLQGFFLGLAILWTVFQIYTFPLLLEQTDQRLRIAFRNSIVLFLRSPVLTVSLLFWCGLLVLISSLVQIPWLVITASLCAFFANRCMLYLIDDLPPQFQPFED